MMKRRFRQKQLQPCEPLPEFISKRAKDCIKSIEHKQNVDVERTDLLDMFSISYERNFLHAGEALNLNAQELSEAFQYDFDEPLSPNAVIFPESKKVELKISRRMQRQEKLKKAKADEEKKQKAAKETELKSKSHRPKPLRQKRKRAAILKRTYAPHNKQQLEKRLKKKRELAAKEAKEESQSNLNIDFPRDSDKNGIESALHKAVTENILKREGYVHQLQHRFREYKKRKTVPVGPKVLKLLFQIRKATLDVVDCIKRWKGLFVRPRSFDFVEAGQQPVNYLLKLSRSMDFLQYCPMFIEWFGNDGVHLLGNVFVFSPRIHNRMRFIAADTNTNSVLECIGNKKPCPNGSIDDNQQDIRNEEQALHFERTFIETHSEDLIRECLYVIREEEIIFGPLQNLVKWCTWCCSIPYVRPSGGQKLAWCSRCRKYFCVNCIEENYPGMLFDEVRRARGWFCFSCAEKQAEEDERRHQKLLLLKEKRKQEEEKLKQWKAKREKETEIAMKSLSKFQNETCLSLTKAKAQMKYHKKQQENARKYLRQRARYAKRYWKKRVAAKRWVREYGQRIKHHVAAQAEAKRFVRALGSTALTLIAKEFSVHRGRASSIDLMEIDSFRTIQDEMIKYSTEKEKKDMLLNNLYMGLDTKRAQQVTMLGSTHGTTKDDIKVDINVYLEQGGNLKEGVLRIALKEETSGMVKMLNIGTTMLQSFPGATEYNCDAMSIQEPEKLLQLGQHLVEKHCNFKMLSMELTKLKNAIRLAIRTNEGKTMLCYVKMNKNKIEVKADVWVNSPLGKRCMHQIGFTIPTDYFRFLGLKISPKKKPNRHKIATLLKCITCVKTETNKISLLDIGETLSEKMDVTSTSQNGFTLGFVYFPKLQTPVYTLPVGSSLDEKYHVKSSVLRFVDVKEITIEIHLDLENNIMFMRIEVVWKQSILQNSVAFFRKQKLQQCGINVLKSEQGSLQGQLSEHLRVGIHFHNEKEYRTIILEPSPKALLVNQARSMAQLWLADFATHALKVEREEHMKLNHVAMRVKAKEYLKNRGKQAMKHMKQQQKAKAYLRYLVARFRTQQKRHRKAKKYLAKRALHAFEHIQKQTDARSYLLEIAKFACDVRRGDVEAKKKLEAMRRKQKMLTRDDHLNAQAHEDRMKQTEQKKDKGKTVMMVRAI